MVEVYVKSMQWQIRTVRGAASRKEKLVTESVGARAAKNAFLNLTRLGISALAALLVPPLLIRHLSPQSYGAWVLVLQVSAILNFLDFGIQTAISKFIAQYHASGDMDGCRRLASTSFALLSLAALVGILVSALLSWQLPHLFHQMPIELLRPARIAVILIGTSIALGLPAATCSGIFLGLQRNFEPVLVQSIGRILSTLGLIAAALTGSGLVLMALVISIINLLTYATQVLVWKLSLPEFRIDIRLANRVMLRKILGYSGILTTWSLALLLISGLDLAIVGHYRFASTAYYAVATSLTNLMIVTQAAVISPLLPVASSLHTREDPSRMGSLLLRSTRYGTLLLLATGLPLLVGAPTILSFWVGPEYAAKSESLLQVLVVANMIRLVGLPYTTLVVATGQLRLATLGTLVEAIVNLTASVLLARHLGAMGVALGTLIGAICNIGIHLAYSLTKTTDLITVTRKTLITEGLMRPALCGLPLLAVVVVHFFSARTAHDVVLPTLATAIAVGMVWLIGFHEHERSQVGHKLRAFHARAFTGQ